MLSLQELKRIVKAPHQGQKTPTAKDLREYGIVVIQERLNKEMKLSVYYNGYVLYEANGAATVFPLHSCKEYMYEGCSIEEKVFEKESWYLRLMLEGEDRLERNQHVKEHNKVVSYSAESEEWGVLETEDCILERMLRKETVEEILSILTEPQSNVVRQYFLYQKTQNQISGELGITVPAVSRILSRAIQRVRRTYPELNRVSICRYGNIQGEQ